MNWRDPERPPSRASAKPTPGPKIIVQYRAKRGKTYELQSAGSVVAVHIVQDPPDDTGDWRVDAQSSPGPATTVVEGRGATAAEALSEVARAWTSHEPALAVFDWDAIARELHVVQAI